MHGRGALEAGAQRKGHSVAGWELPDEQVCVEGHVLGKQTSMRKVKSRRESCARKTEVVLLEGSAHWGQGGLEDKKQERGTRHVFLRSLQGPPLFNMHQGAWAGQACACMCVCVCTNSHIHALGKPHHRPHSQKCSPPVSPILPDHQTPKRPALSPQPFAVLVSIRFTH